MKNIRSISAATALVALIASPNVAQSYDYDFDEMCAPITSHATEASSPDALIILDRSGSMNSSSKLTLAKAAIIGLAQSVHRAGTCSASNRTGCDEVKLGLGWFSNGSAVNIQPAEDTKNSITSTVNGYNASGGTYIGKGAKEIYDSSALRNAERLGVGILISDGGPSGQATTEETLYYLCQARADYNVSTFTVGFGSGSNPAINSLFAAAGGTGECCTGSSCTYQPNEILDICSLPKRSGQNRLDMNSVMGSNYSNLDNAISCRGQIQANSGQELKNKLLDLLAEIACTFPLEIPMDYPAKPPGSQGADQDPEATRMLIDHTVLGNDLEVPFADPANPNAFYDYLVNQRGISAAVADPYKGEGWTFADATRQNVTVTPHICAEIQSNYVSVTETQVACLCVNTGELCDTPCNDGDNDGFDDTTNAKCVKNFGYDSSEIISATNAEFKQAGRCGAGIVECIIGEEFCVQRYQAQPEICNGLDDSCDGNIDNLRRADPTRNYDDDDTDGRDYYEWDGNTSTLSAYGLDEGIFCAFDDVCSCDDGPHIQSPVPNQASPDPDHEWKTLLESYSNQANQCYCRNNLEFGDDSVALDGSSPDHADGDFDDAAACSASSIHPNAGQTGLGLMLLGAAIAGLVRRRRRD